MKEKLCRKVKITYEIEYDYEDIKDMSDDDIIRMAEEDTTSGSGSHEYEIKNEFEDWD